MASSADPDTYEPLQVIGKGSFGIIRKVRRVKDNHVLCRKEISYIKMGVKEREQLHAEFSILSSLRHPNIVAYYHRHHLKDAQDLHLYMEYCGGGDLSKVIQKLRTNNQYADEPFVWSIFSQLVTALYRCHYGVDPPEAGTNVMCSGNQVKPPAGLRGKNQVMILHRDLKPDNVFLGEDNSVKLGDFGLSKLMQSHDFASTYVGTPYYMSPEICAAERYTLYSDIWSLGCVMYELCARRPPFDAKTHFHLIQKIKDGRIDPLPSIYSPELSNAIKSCLKTNPLQRPDTATLLNLPVIRLMRKEREVVELGKLLKMKEEQVDKKLRELENQTSNVEVEREKMRSTIDSTLRREWEVKARLAIDQQIQSEREALQKKFDSEVRERVNKELQQRLRTLNIVKPASPVSPEDQISLSDSKVESSAVTDLSSLSLDSNKSKKTEREPVKRKSRAPFTRARTEFDTPGEVHIPAPSPMSIDCLSLSPRRSAVAAATSIPNSKNIFAAAAKQKSKLNPLGSSPPLASSLDQAILEDSEDEVPDLPSPTRGPSVKLPARPGLLRQKTAPSRRMEAAPALFPTTQNITSKTARIPSPTNILPSGSPIRKAPPRPSVANAGGDEMLKAVMQRNMLGQGGRTLVELAQARAGGAPPNAAAAGVKSSTENQKPIVANSGRRYSEVPVWDPEKDEMPSPFLIRGGKGLRKL
ncbi:MAG: hypothetical protein LQ342_002812 [Letrouitia transgressa]|nr:MAG: hypothetical protein LQ342_002812 [Letrouitia transgressa]